MDADKDVILEDAKEVVAEKSADPVELQEVVEVVTTAKLITKVVTAASATLTATTPQLTTAAAPTLTIAPSAARRRKGVVIRDLESATPSIIIHSESKSKDKGKGILVEEPKPLKKQAQIEQNEAYARELEAELNKNIEWDKVIDHVQRKPKEDKAMKRYQAKRLKKVGSAQRIDTSDDTVMDDEEKSKPAEIHEVVDVFTTAKIITEVVTAASDTIITASTTITVADVPIPAATIAATPTLTAAPSRRRKGVAIKDPQETTTPSTIIHSKAKSKDNSKGILVEEPKPLKKQAQIEQDEVYARELEAELNKNIDWDQVINHVQRKPKEDKSVKRYQALKRKPQPEAQARALKRISESQEDKAAKKQKLDEEVKELKRHLQIVPNDEDDVYTEATPLARKDPVVDYEIYNENNKPYYKIKRADERFSTTKPKNFSDDFLLITLGAMFEKPDLQAQIWKNQRSVHGQAKVKSWKLLESCGVQIITFTTTQLILLVERRYPLTRFALDHMLNNVRLEVEEESEVSLELLSFGVDAAMDFKENMLSV
nr:hypothetical protein [Tanacetum cinerariifolium]